MKRIIIYTITAVVCIGLNTFGVQHFKQNQKQRATTSKEAMQAETIKIVAASTLATVKTETAKLEKAIKAGSAKLVWSSSIHLKAKTAEAKPPKEVLATTKLAAKPKDSAPKKVTIKNITLKKVSFEQLPGWNKSGVKNSLAAFQESCKVFLKKNPTHPVGSQLIKLKAKDWLPACNEAVTIDTTTEASAKTFFEKWFYPLELVKRKPIRGIFTGYYMPLVKGNLTKTKQYNIPIYGLPKQLPWNSQRTHSYTRQAIDKGALNKQAPVIAWIHSPVERLFLEIEGSGVIRLASGKKLYVGYAGENGAHYTPVANVLIKNGVMNKHTASKTAIQRYFQNHPSKVDTILHQNKSFVFFENLKKPVALGVQDITLTPGYSLAIDRKWIPLGSPLWLSTKNHSARITN